MAGSDDSLADVMQWICDAAAAISDRVRALEQGQRPDPNGVTAARAGSRNRRPTNKGVSDGEKR